MGQRTLKGVGGLDVGWDTFGGCDGGEMVGRTPEVATVGCCWRLGVGLPTSSRSPRRYNERGVWWGVFSGRGRE